MFNIDQSKAERMKDDKADVDSGAPRGKEQKSGIT